MALVTIYAMRHQRGGVDTSKLYGNLPNEEQLATYKAGADARFGAGWVRVVEVPLAMPVGEFAPFVPPPPQEPNGEAGLPAMTISAVGHVGG